MDGSALPWMTLLKPALEKTEARFPTFQIQKSIEIETGEGVIRATPSETLSISYLIDFPNTPIGLQTWEGPITPEIFERELAPARTFGFMEEVKTLWERGLAQGGNLENCVVLTHNASLTPLRFPDEMVRHKVLDLMGDLALLASVPMARLEVQKGSHRLHTALARALLKFSSAKAR